MKYDIFISYRREGGDKYARTIQQAIMGGNGDILTRLEMLSFRASGKRFDTLMEESLMLRT